jgi:hypothetical protein
MRLAVIGILLVVLAASWFVGGKVIRERRRLRRRRNAATAGQRVNVAWIEACEALARAGLGRRTAETELEYAQRAGSTEPDVADPMSRLVGASVAASYAAGDLDEQTVEAAVADAALIEHVASRTGRG